MQSGAPPLNGAAPAALRTDRPRRAHRQIGPVGTVARIAGGAATVALPIGLNGFSWWDAVIALVALPLIAAVAAPLVTSIFRRLAPNALASRHAICSGPACSLIAVIVAVNAVTVAPTPRDDARGNRRSSRGCARYRDLLTPAGLGSELRSAFVADSTAWRADPRPPSRAA